MNLDGATVGNLKQRLRSLGDALKLGQPLFVRARLREREVELARQNLHFTAALDNMPHGLVMFDRDLKLIICNAKYLEMYRLNPDVVKPGVSIEAVAAARLKAGTGPKTDGESYFAERTRRSENSSTLSAETELEDGRICAAVRQPMADGGWVALHRDVTEERMNEQKIAHLAHNDVLTGLPNRLRLNEQIQASLHGMRTQDQSVAILCLDLDQFKNVNDTLGHLVGDDLLRVVSRRFESSLDGRGLMARLGGDEFAFAARAHEEADVVDIARQLVASLADPCVLDGVSVRVGASAGVAMASRANGSIAELLRAADVAMYEAKRSRSGVSIYQAVNDPNSREQLELVGALHDAIDRRELTLNFQPTLDLATGEICGVEALARWRHEDIGMVAPDVFIPMAENAGLMPELTRLVLEMAVDKAAHIDTTGRTINMSVNISRLDLLDDELPGFIERLLAKHGYPAQRLTLEITETTLSSDPDQTARSI